MSTSSVNYNLQNLYGQSGPQNLFGAGSNQYGGGWPTYPSATPTPVPSSGPYNAQTPSIQGTQGGYYTGTAYDPSLTSSLFGYLGSQVGQGLPTYPGQLTAAPNQLYGQLGSLLTGGQSNLPYGQQMLQMAQTGNPTDVGPAWEAMLAASQQNIAENQAQLKEQYAAGGNLVGTPYGSAMSDYMSQTALGENAILTQAQQQAAEAAAGRQLSAQQGLTSADLSLGGNLQQIAQTGATNAYNEWLRTQPQYNPLLGQAYGASTTFPPYLNPQQSPWAMIIPAILNSINIPGLSKKPTPPGPSPSPGPGPSPSPSPGPNPSPSPSPGPGPGPSPNPGPGGQQSLQSTYSPNDPNAAMNALLSQYLNSFLQGGSNTQGVDWQNLINALSGGQGGAPTTDPYGGSTTGGASLPGGGTGTPADTGYGPAPTYDPYGGSTTGGVDLTGSTVSNTSGDYFNNYAYGGDTSSTYYQDPSIYGDAAGGMMGGGYYF